MSFLKSFLNIISPQECIVCGDLLYSNEKYICTNCLEDLPLTYYWTWEENPAEKKLWGRTYFERVIPLFFFEKENNYKKIPYSLKYKNDIKVGIYFGQILGQHILSAKYGDKKLGDEIDLIVPIPLHKKKQKKRGYNQSEMIAKGINSILNKRICPKLIERKKNTETQTGIDMEHKWDNVKDAFEVNKKEMMKIERKYNKPIHILLVDDVLTTGATSVA